MTTDATHDEADEGRPPDGDGQAGRDKRSDVERLVERAGYQQDLLAALVRGIDTANCHLRSISRTACEVREEAREQTRLQRRLADDVRSLLEFSRIAAPEAAMQWQREAEMRRALEECCPDETEPEPEPCGCGDCGDDRDDDSGTRDTREVAVPPHRVDEAPYPPVERPERPSRQPNDRPERIVPDGPVRGILVETPGTAPEEMGSGADIQFDEWTSDSTVAPASTNAADISGAQSEGVVMLSGNWYVDFSTDGGASFTTLDPTTIFPESLANGFCCDQVIQYVPEIDRFLWLLQYQTPAAGGANAYRLAAASPKDIIDSGCTRWTYWDLTSATFGFGTDWMDYPSMSIGDDHAYFSFDVLDTTADTIADNGLVVVRIPLSEIAAAATINFRFTNPGDSLVAWGSNVSQNTGDEVFWAGHIDNSTMRVFNWPASSTSYSWRSVGVSNWPNATLSSNGPNGNNWFGWGFPTNAVIGITRRAGEVWMAWTASSGQGSSSGFTFPHPHVQVVKIDDSTFGVKEQMQIWNPDHAFGYPCFATNESGEVGVALGWGGGGSFHMNTAVGFMGDYVVYFRDGSTWTHTRSGDYVSIRQAGSDPDWFAGFGYVTVADGSTVGHRFDPYYVLFGRPDVVIR